MPPSYRQRRKQTGPPRCKRKERRELSAKVRLSHFLHSPKESAWTCTKKSSLFPLRVSVQTRPLIPILFLFCSIFYAHPPLSNKINTLHVGRFFVAVLRLISNGFFVTRWFFVARGGVKTVGGWGDCFISTLTTAWERRSWWHSGRGGRL
jgi:hypothetical protein